MFSCELECVMAGPSARLASEEVTPGIRHINSEGLGWWWLGSMYLVHMERLSVDKELQVKEMILTKSNTKHLFVYSSSYISVSRL